MAVPGSGRRLAQRVCGLSGPSAEGPAGADPVLYGPVLLDVVIPSPKPGELFGVGLNEWRDSVHGSWRIFEVIFCVLFAFRGTMTLSLVLTSRQKNILDSIGRCGYVIHWMDRVCGCRMCIMDSRSIFVSCGTMSYLLR